MTDIHELPADIMAGAVMDSTGSFTVALDKAQDKLRRFQLPDPRAYILQIVQAVVASQATDIEVTVTGSAGELVDTVPDGVAPGYRILLTFDGPGYTREELETLFSFIFESQRKRDRDRLREMALGLLSCQALEPMLLRLSSNGTQWTRRARWLPHLEASGDHDTTVGPCPPAPRHTFELRRLGVPTEPGLIRESCQALPVHMRLNGDVVNLSNQLASSTPWPAWTFDTGVMRGCIGLPYEPLSETRLHLFRYGVRIHIRKEDRIYPPVVVMLDHPGLRKNVSQSDIVEDATWQACLVDLQQLLLSFANALWNRRLPTYQQGSVQSFLLNLVADWIPPPLTLAGDEDVAPELLPLLNRPMFADRQGTLRSIRDVARYYRRDGFVGILTKRFPAHESPWPDILMLNPSKVEKATLEQLFNKLVVLDNWAQSLAQRSRAAEDELATMEPNGEFILSSKTERDNRVFKVGLENTYPSGTCRIQIYNPKRQSRVFRQRLHDWSLYLEVRIFAMDEPYLVLQQALQILEEMAPSLYDRLLDELLRDTATVVRRSRIREHLVGYWGSCVARHTSRIGRAVWGDAKWDSPVLETRSGAGVSLADLEVWLGQGQVVVLTYGGGRLKEDYALDASPATVRLLSHLFDKSRLVQATQGRPYTEERLLQRQLPSISKHATVPVVVRPVEEPEPIMDTTVPVEIAVPVTEREPVAPLPPPAVVAVPVSEPTVFVQHRFHHPPLQGVLQLSSGETQVAVRVAGQESQSIQLFELPIGGWIEAEHFPADWPPREWDIVRTSVVGIFDRLAGHMRRVGDQDPNFGAMRDLLLRYLLRFKEGVESRFERPGLHDPLLNLRFLPLMGGGLASMLMLWMDSRAHGALPVMREGTDPPPVESPPVEVGARVPASFYETFFGPLVEVSEAVLAVTPEVRLLMAIRRELKNLSSSGELRLSDAILSNISWSSLTTQLVRHEPHTGVTLLNVDHRLWRDALRRFDTDRSALPMLVSLIHSAIRRATDEADPVRDMAVLMALLRRAPAEG